MESEDKLIYLSNKYNEFNLPLFLSYPVESFWNKGNDHVQQMNCKEEGVMIDLYIHYPFCDKICYFCCCDKLVTQKEEEKEYYIQTIEKEMKLKYGTHERLKVNSMHWGGGTPTNMNLQQLEHLFHILNLYFDFRQAEKLNIEAYPDKKRITREKLQLLRKLGFHSISYGIQDFDHKVQHAIHRIDDINETQRLILMAHEEGFEVHVDLCYGLPYQGVDEFRRTLQIIKKTMVDKIVIYPYAHYPFLYPLQKKIDITAIPDQLTKLRIMQLAAQMLVEHYDKYGIDTFIRKNTVSMNRWKGQQKIRNFMGTSVESSRALVGIGMSAVSKAGNSYCRNHAKLKAYEDDVNSGILPTEKYYLMTDDDIIRNYVIQNQILGSLSIDKKVVEDKYNIIFDEYFKQELQKINEFEKDELVKCDRNRISITNSGELFARTIANAFNTYK